MRDALALLGALLFVGCVHTGDVTEVSPVTAKLGSYHSVSVTASSADGVKNGDQNAATLRSAVQDRLKSDHVFADVVDDPAAAELVLACRITRSDEGSQLARGLSVGGDSEVEVNVDLVDKDKKKVGQLSVTGNSKKSSSTRIGGVDTDAIADTTGRALGAAADQIVGYVKSKQ